MLKPLADDLYALEDSVRLPFGISMPSRATVVRLAQDRLVVISPTAIDDTRARAIDALGEVTAVVAPNVMHNLFFSAAAQRWPKARVFAPPSIAKKVKGLDFTPLGGGGDDPFGGELIARRVDGVPGIDEHVFFHPRSRTLVVTDLVFNVHAASSWSTRLLFRMVGAWKKLETSRSWRFVTKDRDAAAASVADILGWDFDRLVMAHGDVVAQSAYAPFAHAVRWLANGKVPPRLAAPAPRETVTTA